MSGFADSFISGFQTGHQIRRQKEQQEREQEERSLHQLLLKDQLNRLKTQDKVSEYHTKYGAADAQFNAQQGQPAASFTKTIPEAGAGAIPGAPPLSQGMSRETVPANPQPVQYPGYDGGEGFARTPQTMEEVLKRQAQIKFSEAMSTPYNLPPGAVRKVGDTTIGENPKEAAPPSLQSVNRSVGGKPTTLNFNPKTGAYTDQSGQSVSGVAPIPPASSASAGGGLDPDAIDYTAAAYRILGTKAIPTRIEGADRVKIMNAAAKQSKALGQSPAAVLQKQAAFKADGAALTKMTTASAAAESFENKALAQADIIDQLSAQVPRSQYPIINKAIIGGNIKLIGDSKTQQLANAVQTFAAEYAKIIEGSTGSSAGSSDASRRAADRLINTAMNKGTMADVVQLMRREMRLTIHGYGATIEHINERLGGAKPQGANDPLGIRQ